MSPLVKADFWVFVLAWVALGAAGIAHLTWEFSRVLHVPLDDLDPTARAALLNQDRFLRGLELGLGIAAVPLHRP